MDDMVPVSLSRESSGEGVGPWQSAPSIELVAPSGSMVMNREQPSVGQPLAEGAEQFVPPGMNGGSKDNVIWEGTTWDAFPTLCMCCAPLCCLSRKWRVTTERIEMQHGCCGTKEDTIYVNRIKDLSLDGNCCTAVLCCGRNTVHIHASDVTHPEIRITNFSARKIYKALRDAKGNKPPEHIIHQM